MSAVLQQSQKTGANGSQFVLRQDFFTDFQAKYFFNELELLAIYGEQFKFFLDHKTLMTALRANRGNKTFSSRFTRWVDRLLPIEFEVVYVPVRTLGMSDYLSRQPSELQGASVKAETLWNEWFTVNSVISLNNVLDNNGVTSEQGESVKCEKKNHSVNRINVANEKVPNK